MAELIYFTPMSLDGFIADETGDPSWAAPDEEVFAFINDLLRPIGTYLYGRKMYETMRIWETPEGIPGATPGMREFARIWQAADKIVYSTSLKSVQTSRTRLEREFNPRTIRDLKTQLAGDVSVAGPTLAAEAIRSELLDEYRLLVVPATIGRGTRVLPSDVSLKLDLLEERRFANGMVYLRYRTASRPDR